MSDDGNFDPNELTPDMKINVTLGEFHDTHDRAGDTKEKMKKVPFAQWSKEDLEAGLAALRAAQRLTDAETSSDFMFAMGYDDEIRILKDALAQR